MALLLYLGYQIKELITVKVKKTYRLTSLAVDQIQEIRSYYSKQGLDLTDSQVVQKAVDTLMNSIYQQKISDYADSVSFEIEKE